jgi:hypothetical protein
MPNRMAKRAGIAIACAVGAGIAPVSCRAPTEVVVEVSVDFSCHDLKGVTLTFGQLHDIETTPPAVQTTACSDDGTVGSVVLVPSGSDDGALAIKIVAGFGQPVDQCAQGGPGCIVARRSLRYVPHTPLHVPVLLQASCAGVRCQDTETCVASACVPAAVDPSTCETPDGCVLPGDTVGADAGPGDVAVDAATGAPDADDGAADATPDADDGAVDAGDDGGGAVDASEGGVVTLATGQTGPTQIAVGSGFVFWTNGGADGSVMAVPAAGGTPVPVATQQDSPWGSPSTRPACTGRTTSSAARSCGRRSREVPRRPSRKASRGRRGSPSTPRPSTGSTRTAARCARRRWTAARP